MKNHGRTVFQFQHQSFVFLWGEDWQSLKNRVCHTSCYQIFVQVRDVHQHLSCPHWYWYVYMYICIIQIPELLPIYILPHHADTEMYKYICTYLHLLLFVSSWYACVRVCTHAFTRFVIWGACTQLLMLVMCGVCPFHNVWCLFSVIAIVKLKWSWANIWLGVNTKHCV
jgi:hypothetical protein